MNILYIGSFPPKFLIEQSGGKIDSLYRDSEALIEGLRCIDDVHLDVITSPDIPSWPRGPFFIKKKKSEKERVVLVSSLNLPFVKQLWTIITMLFASIGFIGKSQEKVAVMIPYLVFRHVVTLRLLSLLFPKKVIQLVVVPDIFFPKKWLMQKVNKLTEKMVSKFDGFVFYTKKMSEHLQIESKRFIVIEGYRRVPNRLPLKDKAFKVVYAGSLNLNYGIGRLLDAMKLIDDRDVQLHLYGAGTGESAIMESCENDDRISYHGRVPNAESVDAIYSASVLVNPRNSNDGEYTEYSFPSKDIEYMSTGVPTLLCKLPGMPQEYYGHFIDIGQGTPQEIAQAILLVKNMSEQERKEIGTDSRKFIIERMDCKRQAETIIDLIKNIA